MKNKTTKKLIAITTAVLLAFTVITMTGCKTASPQTITHIATASRIVAKDATYLVVKNNPQLKGEFVTARNSLTVIGTATNLDFNLAVSIVSQFPIKSINDPITVMLIQDGQLILSDLNATYPLKDVENLRPIVIGLRDGVDDGLRMGIVP